MVEITNSQKGSLFKCNCRSLLCFQHHNRAQGRSSTSPCLEPSKPSSFKRVPLLSYLLKLLFIFLSLSTRGINFLDPNTDKGQWCIARKNDWQTKFPLKSVFKKEDMGTVSFLDTRLRDQHNWNILPTVISNVTLGNLKGSIFRGPKLLI